MPLTPENNGSRGLRLRGLTLVVLVAFAATSLALFFAAGKIGDDEERKLIQGRTAEAAALLGGVLANGLQASVSGLAQASRQPTTDAFTQAATVLTKASSAVAGAALLQRQGTGWEVLASSGDLPAKGSLLSGPRAALLNSLAGKPQTDVLQLAGGTSRLGLGLGAPSTAANQAVYVEYTVDPSRPLQVPGSQPFHELDAAVYAAATPVASKLILTTTKKLPLHGRTASAPVNTGGNPWLVVAKAKQPLSGTLANQVPLILLLATAVIGLAMAAVVEGVGRRRDYAMALVFERTSELRDSVQQLEQTQEALLASERLAALGQMAATVGHELRNPLGVLTNSMYLIRAATAGTADERLTRHLSTADREIAAATLIVSDLLEFARPRQANPIHVDVADLLEETLSVAPPATGIVARRDEIGDLPPVVADRDQLRQVLLNLLTNAYEAMPTGGTVELGARVSGDGVEVTVRDDGPGLDETTAQRLFEPFFSSKLKGTGLGLAVSKRIVESHRGTLRLANDDAGGCVATVWLPLAHVDVPAGA